MATFFTDAALDEMLNALDVDYMTLHSGDPGATGVANVISDAPVACVLAASEDNTGTGRKRHINADVAFTGAGVSATVAYFGLWKGATYKAGIARTSGDATTNAAEEYTVTTGTTIVLDV